MNLNNENYRKQLFPLLIYLFISFLFVSLATIHLFDPIYNLAGKISGSLSASLYGSGETFRSYTGAMADTAGLVNDNTKLKQEIYKLESLQAENTLLIQENQALSDQLGVKGNAAYHYVLGLITSESSDQTSITINKGTNEGVVDNAVVVYQNLLVGRVADAKAENAQIELITDPQSNIPVVVTGTNVQAVLNGSVQYGLLANDILPDETVNPGSTVVTSGLGDTYPEGLLIGTIQSVQGVSSQPFKQAVVSGALSLNSLTSVFVIKQ